MQFDQVKKKHKIELEQANLLTSLNSKISILITTIGFLMTGKKIKLASTPN